MSNPSPAILPQRRAKIDNDYILKESYSQLMSLGIYTPDPSVKQLPTPSSLTAQVHTLANIRTVKLVGSPEAQKPRSP